MASLLLLYVVSRFGLVQSDGEYKALAASLNKAVLTPLPWHFPESCPGHSHPVVAANCGAQASLVRVFFSSINAIVQTVRLHGAKHILFSVFISISGLDPQIQTRSLTKNKLDVFCFCLFCLERAGS